MLSVRIHVKNTTSGYTQTHSRNVSLVQVSHSRDILAGTFTDGSRWHFVKTTKGTRVQVWSIVPLRMPNILKSLVSNVARGGRRRSLAKTRGKKTTVWCDVRAGVTGNDETFLHNENLTDLKIYLMFTFRVYERAAVLFEATDRSGCTHPRRSESLGC